MIQLAIGVLIVASGLNLLIIYFFQQNYFSTKVFLLAMMVVNTLCVSGLRKSAIRIEVKSGKDSFLDKLKVTKQTVN